MKNCVHEFSTIDELLAINRILSPLSSMSANDPHFSSLAWSVYPFRAPSPNHALQLTPPQCHGGCCSTHASQTYTSTLPATGSLHATAPAQLSLGR
jgi:hypothetical protein